MLRPTMADTPEIPEAEDPFSTRVAISIAGLAAALSFIQNVGDNAKTDAILKTTEAANQWGYFQAKSIKETTYEVDKDLLKALTESSIAAPKRDELVAKYEKKIATYKSEKAAIGPGEKDAQGQWVEKKDDQGKNIVSAVELSEQANHQIRINDVCDQASLYLQVAIIVCSVAILVKKSWFWYGGLAIGLVGIGIGAKAWMM